MISFTFQINKTRKYSGRMRTARLSTVSRSISYIGGGGSAQPPRCRPPPIGRPGRVCPTTLDADPLVPDPPWMQIPLPLLDTDPPSLGCRPPLLPPPFPWMQTTLPLDAEPPPPGCRPLPPRCRTPGYKPTSLLVNRQV